MLRRVYAGLGSSAVHYYLVLVETNRPLAGRRSAHQPTDCLYISPPHQSLSPR